MTRTKGSLAVSRFQASRERTGLNLALPAQAISCAV